MEIKVSCILTFLNRESEYICVNLKALRHRYLSLLWNVDVTILRSNCELEAVAIVYDSKEITYAFTW